MPIIKSAQKRVRTSAKATVRNAKVRRAVRETTKEFKKAVSVGKSKDIIEAQNKAISAIDVAQKKNIIHKNKAARKKSQLAAEAKKAGAKPATKKSAGSTKKTPAKTTTKKPAPKKAPAKKTTTKKTTKKS